MREQVNGTVDRDNDVPLYAQISADLERQIADHALAPGEVLPSEQQLQSRYQVSRSVIRQALEALSAQGLVVKQRGRGTTVAPPRTWRRAADRAGGLGQQIAQSGADLRTQILDLERVPVPASAAADLEATDAWRLTRLRSVSGRPLIFMETLIPYDIFPALSAEELGEGSLHAWMTTQGQKPEGGPRRLQAVAATGQVADGLQVAHGRPLMLMEGVTRNGEGRCLESFKAWHQSDVVFDVDAHVTTSGDALAPQERTRLRDLIEEMRSLL